MECPVDGGCDCRRNRAVLQSAARSRGQHDPRRGGRSQRQASGGPLPRAAFPAVPRPSAVGAAHPHRCGGDAQPREAPLLRALRRRVLCGRARRRGRRAHRAAREPALQPLPRQAHGPVLPVRVRRGSGGGARPVRARLRARPCPRPEPARRPQGLRAAGRVRHAGRRLRVPPGHDDDELQPALLPAVRRGARVPQGGGFHLLLPDAGEVQAGRAHPPHRRAGRRATAGCA